MRKVLIDTNIYVEFKRNNRDVVDSFRGFDHIGVDICVLAELYSGFRLGGHDKKNFSELESFINSPRVAIYNHDLNTSEFYSNIYINLRKKGTPIPTNDIWIAAVAMQNGLAVYTKDNHFSQIYGLIIY